MLSFFSFLGAPLCGGNVVQKRALVDEGHRHGSSSFIDDDDVPGGHLESGEEVELITFQRQVREASFVQKFTWYLAYIFSVMIGARPWDDQELAAAVVEQVPRTMVESFPTAFWRSSGLLHDLCTFTEVARLPESGFTLYGSLQWVRKKQRGGSAF
jgi:hypothetical protein